ncbi:unnamed protein product [Moneuplotes crassus]|uniref:Uncharacterized protein n=1 Tax=Euplotes crassus TaxID=5936 RepID=A0AAD2DBI0_EUPCR|nr:unnamed protein product [Moneuplotes crassus]
MNIDLNNELTHPISNSDSHCSSERKGGTGKLVLPKEGNKRKRYKERYQDCGSGRGQKACLSALKNQSQEEVSKMENTNSTNFYMNQKFLSKDEAEPPEKSAISNINKDVNIQISQDNLEGEISSDSNFLVSPINIQESKKLENIANPKSLRKRPQTRVRKLSSSSRKKDRFNINLTKVDARKQSLFKYQWPLNGSNQSMKACDLAISVKVKDLKKPPAVRSPGRYKKEEHNEEPPAQVLPQTQTQPSKIPNPELTKISMQFIPPKKINSQNSQEVFPSRIHSLKGKPNDPSSRSSVNNFEGKKLLKQKKSREKTLRNKINVKVDLPKKESEGIQIGSFRRKRFSQHIESDKEILFDYQSSKEISEKECRMKVDNVPNLFHRKRTTITHFDKDAPSMLEEPKNNYESTSDIYENNQIGTEKVKDKSPNNLRKPVQSRHIRSVPNEMNSYTDIHSNRYKEPDAKIAKFGMLIASKKAKQIFKKINKRPNTSLHHKLYQNIVTRNKAKQVKNSHDSKNKKKVKKRTNWRNLLDKVKKTSSIASVKSVKKTSIKPDLKLNLRLQYDKITKRKIIAYDNYEDTVIKKKSQNKFGPLRSSSYDKEGEDTKIRPLTVFHNKRISLTNLRIRQEYMDLERAKYIKFLNESHHDISYSEAHGENEYCNYREQKLTRIPPAKKPIELPRDASPQFYPVLKVQGKATGSPLKAPINQIPKNEPFLNTGFYSENTQKQTNSDLEYHLNSFN